jgi:hypothetical protein
LHGRRTPEWPAATISSCPTREHIDIGPGSRDAADAREPNPREGDVPLVGTVATRITDVARMANVK